MLFSLKIFVEYGRHEKGGIENVNGVIRVESPRSPNIDALKQKDILRITEEINNRPLKFF